MSSCPQRISNPLKVKRPQPNTLNAPQGLPFTCQPPGRDFYTKEKRHAWSRSPKNQPSRLYTSLSRQLATAISSLSHSRRPSVRIYSSSDQRLEKDTTVAWSANPAVVVHQKAMRILRRAGTFARRTSRRGRILSDILKRFITMR